jgi:hypothetical protein
MSSDGPKNSQGYIPYPAAAGMTGEPYFVQLLDYTNGEFTEEVAKAWLRDAPEGAVRLAFINLDSPLLEPALRTVLLRKLRRLRRPR